MAELDSMCNTLLGPVSRGRVLKYCSVQPCPHTSLPCRTLAGRLSGLQILMLKGGSWYSSSRTTKCLLPCTEITPARLCWPWCYQVCFTGIILQLYGCNLTHSCRFATNFLMFQRLLEVKDNLAVPEMRQRRLQIPSKMHGGSGPVFSRSAHVLEPAYAMMKLLESDDRAASYRGVCSSS